MGRKISAILMVLILAICPVKNAQTISESTGNAGALWSVGTEAVYGAENQAATGSEENGITERADESESKGTDDSEASMRNTGGVLMEENTKLLAGNSMMTMTTSLEKYTTVEEAADSVRKRVINHASKITVYIKSKTNDPVGVYDEFEAELFKETEEGNEGDYMLWDIDREYPSYTYKAVRSGSATYYYYTFTVEYTYLTTLEQKAQVDAKVEELIEDFGFTENITDYEKIKTIYDYICSTVTYAYDYESSDIYYTSWAALFEHEAVCQGYAQLLYRMLKEVGISCRVIPGYGTDSSVMHGWNIVQLGGYYYNVDATWDAELYGEGKSYKYFLKGDNFKQHTRLDSYATTEFYAAYPMAANDYGDGEATLSTASTKAAFKTIKPKFKRVSRKKIKLVKVADAYKYEIKYATNKSMSKNVKDMTTKKTKFKLKGLKKKNKYFVRFRAYTYVDGEKIYTKWSKKKKIKRVKNQ